MTRLDLKLLGGFELRTPEGEALAGPDTRKARALLAYLAMHAGRPLRREVLSDLLWSRSGQKQAASSLSQALYSIRKALAPFGDNFIDATQETAALDAGAVRVDAAIFEEKARSGEPAVLRVALSLYDGPLLDGLDIAEDRFGIWLSAERARLEGIAVDAGIRLLEMRETPDRESAADAERLLALDPCNETAHRHLMLFHARAGQVPQALRQYERCREVLKTGLDVEPSQATRDLCDCIRAGDMTPAATAKASPAPAGGAGSRRPAGAAIAVLAVAAIAVVALWIALRPEASPPGPDVGAPRLAVLPFETASGDADARVFAGGMADDITTELSRYPGLAVMSRETALHVADGEEEAGDLGISHLLRGRIRREAGRLTVNAWITETASREQVWAKRYQGDAADLPGFQDTILDDVVTALAAVLPETGGGPDAGAGTGDPAAYEAYLSGLTAYFEAEPDANARAAGSFREALDVDPDFAKARAGLAKTYWRAAFSDQAYAGALGLNWVQAYLEMKALLARHGDKAAGALLLEAGLALRRRDYADALAMAREALGLEPSNAEAMLVLAETLVYSGDPDAGESHARLALQLNPALPARPAYVSGLARFARGDTEGAIVKLRDAIDMAGRANAEYAGLLAAMLGAAGDADGAAEMRAAYVAALQDRPRREWQVATRPLDNPRARSWDRPGVASAVYAYPFSDRAILERLAAGFEAAGLAGGTIGHFPASAGHRLDNRDIRDLLFGASVEGPGETEAWHQTRDGTGTVVRASGLGPMLLVPEGASTLRDGEICDTWQWSGREIAACAAVFRVPDEARIAVLGDYLMATEFGPFPFRVERSGP